MADAKWTVMVLMGANNIEGERDLSAFAERDIREMQQAEPTDGILNVVVQIDQKEEAGGPQRFKLTKDGPTEVQRLPKGQGSSGDPDVLGEFLRWAKTYRSQHYLLVLWGHAYRLAFNRDPVNTEGLDFIKLSQALDKTNGGEPLDIVAFDSCNVSLIEGAYQLRNVARYLVASQFSDPLPGWPYRQILRRILTDRSNLAGSDGPENLGRAIVSQFIRHYARSNHVTMTMLDLGRVNDLPAAIDELSIELTLAASRDQKERLIVDQAFQQSQVPGPNANGQPSVDLMTFCWNLVHMSGENTVRIAAAALADLLFFPRDARGRRNPFIIAHARNDLVVAMLQGVSIFAPNVTTDTDFGSQSLRSKYAKLDLPRTAPHWPELVFALAHRE